MALAISYNTLLHAQTSCATATTITGTSLISDPGPSAGGGCFNCGSTAANASWYSFTAPADGTIDVSACSLSNTDTRLWIYDGTCGTLNQVASSDDDCGLSSEVTGLAVTNGVTYYIEWDDRWSAAAFDFNFVFSPTLVSGNNTCATAAVIATAYDTISDAGPSTGAGCFNCSNAAANASWYSFTAPADGTIDLIACGLSSTDTRLWVYEGSCGALVQVGADDDACTFADGYASSITGLSVTGGLTYYIEWDDRWSGVAFDFIFSFQEQGKNCALPNQLTTNGLYSDSGPSSGAGCFNCSLGATNGSWYEFTAPSNGIIDISACGLSANDTRLWVYDGSCGTLNQIAADDDGCGSADGFASEILGIQAATGTTYYFEWDDRWSGAAFDFNFTFTAASCLPSSNMVASVAGSDSLVLNWVSGPTTPNYNIEYGPTGYTFGSGTTLTALTDTFTTVSGLSSNTTYDFNVQDSCGVGNVSSWAGPFTFTTLFGISCPTGTQTAVFQEEFDNSTGWTGNIASSATNANWVFPFSGSPGSGNGPFGPHSGSNYMYAETSGSGWPYIIDAVSPLIDLSAGQNAAALTFYYHAFGADVGTLDVGVSNSPTGPWTSVLNIVGQQQTSSGAPYSLQSASLDAFLGQQIFIRFNYVSGLSFNGDVGIDLMEVYTCITCPPPSNVLTSNLTSSSVDLNWTSGGAANAQVEYGPTGFILGSGTLVPVVGTSLSITGLSPNVTYDIYVKDSCAVGDVSPLIGAETITTLCASIMSGTYTINPAIATGGTNFSSFADATSELNACGVSSPVTINIAPGLYIERLHLFSVPGASATNTITFNGTGADTLVWDQTGPQATVLIDNTPHVTLNGMIIANLVSAEGWGVLVTNNSDTVTINNCTVVSDSVSTSLDLSPILVSNSYDNDLSEGADVDGLTVINSTIIGGYYAMNFEGVSATVKSVGYTIDNNTIRQFNNAAIYIDEIEDISITNNLITSDRGLGDGIYAFDVNDYTIEGNEINVGDWALYITDGNDGFTPTTRSRIVNNLIISTSDYAIYLNDFEATDVFHNSTSGSPGIAINDQVDVDIRNNIFTSDGDFAFESLDALTATDVIDNNLYFKSGAGNAFDIGPTPYADLAAWQAGDAARNLNSLEGDPVFVSPTDLRVLGSLANNAGDPTVGILVDIDGDPRSATTPDLGADEFTAVTGDLALVAGMLEASACYSTNDTAQFYVQNVIGTTVDFSVDALTLDWSVIGPFTSLNSSGSVTISTGTLLPGDTLVIKEGGVNLSAAGTYSLNAFIQTNGVNLSPLNDTLAQVDFARSSLLLATPNTTTITSSTDSLELAAFSPAFPNGGFFITEICHFAGASVGSPAGGKPPWLFSDDYIEITGSPGSDIGGYTLETWTTSALTYTHTFPSGTLLSPNGTAIIGVGASVGAESPGDFYYVAPGGSYSSGTAAGRILKDSQGNIEDAVGYSGSTVTAYNFPALANVPASDWSSSLLGGGSSWGIRLEGADVNSGSNWVLSATSPQNPNDINTGVSVPATPPLSGFTWSLNGVTIDTATTTFVGPWSFFDNGTYKYVASYNLPGCGLVFDTATVIVDVPISCISGNLGIVSAEDFEVQGGWTGISSGGGNWGYNTGTTSSTATGPTGAYSGNQYVYFEASGGTNATATMVSPAIDLSSGNNIAVLSFWTHAYGTNIGTLNVGASASATGPFTQVYTQTGPTQTANSDPWNNVVADLTSFIGQTVYLQFEYTNGASFNGDMSIDLIEISSCVTCPAPSALGAINILATSADVFWTGGGAVNWDVQYGTSGFTLGTGTVVNATNDTVSLTGLSPATNYEFYVRDSCAVGDVSAYVSPFAFATPCVTFTAPYMQDFDGLALTTPFTDLPICWTPQVGPDFWDVTNDVANNGHSFLPNIGDHTTGTGNYMWIDASSDITANEMVSPDIDISGLTNPYVGFWFASNNVTNATNHTIALDAWDGTAWVNLTSLSGNFTAWTEVAAIVPATIPTTTKFRIYAIPDVGTTASTYFQNDLGVDDFFVMEQPTCPLPSALGALNITATGADIYWTTGGASNWNVEYGVTGFPQGTGTLVNATNDTLSLSGLSPSTSYSFYVRDSCGLGDVSAWAGPFSFFTLCAPITPPSIEDFSAGFLPTPCWDQATGGNAATGPTTLGTSRWIADGFDNTTSTGAFKINMYTASANEWALSPQYDLSTAGNLQVEFDFAVFAWNTANPASLGSDDRVELLISTDGGVTWTALQTFDNTYVTPAGGSKVIQSLAAYTGIVQFAIWATEGTTDDPEDNDIMVDNFAVLAPAACAAPSGLAAFNLTTTTADVTWLTNNTPAAGSYVIEYDTVGFTAGTGNNQASANDTATISGLTQNTAYDFYVRAICGPGDTSAYAGPFTFNTLCAIIPLPYTETFELASSTTLSCWAVGANWGLAAAGGFGTSTNSVVFPFYNVAGGPTRFFAVSPEFTPAPMGYQLSLDHAYATFATEVDSIIVEYSTDGGLTYTNLVILDGGLNGPLNTAGASAPAFVPTATQWSNFSIAIPMGTNRVRIAAVSAFGNNAYFDNVSIEPAPLCVAPTGAAVANITTTSADVSWTSGTTAISTVIEYGVAGFLPGTGTVIPNATSAQTIAGLMSGTTYEACVYDICGPGDTSLAACVTFATTCAPINMYPYLETFDGSNGIPTCYTASTLPVTTPFQWLSNAGPTTSTATGPAADHTQGNAVGRYVYTEASGGSAAGDTAILTLPEFDLTPLTTPELVYWYHMYGADITRLNLEVFNTTTLLWDSVFSIVGQQQAANGDAWLQQRFDLSAYATATNLRMRFVTFKGASFNGDVAIDDIEVRETPACIDPTNLLAINATTSSVVLTWASDTNIIASTVEYGPVGFTLGTGTQVNGPRATAGTVNGLTGGTCFDFYVKDSCTTATAWIGPVTACTLGSCSVNTTPTSATGDTLPCLGGPADLNAVSSTSNDLLWLQNGIVREVGSGYITDSLTFTNVFNVAEFTATSPSTSVGPEPSIAAAGFGNFTNGQYITVDDTIIIDSTTVRANGDVTAFVQVWDIARNGVIQRGDTFTTPAGVTANYRVPVNMVLTPGTYFMNVDFLAGAGQLFRATGGANYPYILPGLMSIDSVEFPSQIRYYYTFDLGVRKACIGPSISTTAILPGSNAGSNDTVFACGNNASVQLVSGLGVYDAGGTWFDDDATGALTDSIFDATAVLADTTYNFTYIVAGVNGCPGDTAVITVAVEATPDAGLDVVSDVCETAGPFRLSTLLSVSGFGGRWLDLDASGAFNVNSSIFNPANATAGNTYNFAFISDGNVCPNDTAIVTLTVDPVANAGTSKTDTVCDDSSAVDLATFLDATASAGGTWVDVSATGALTGSIFNVTAVANGSTYSFRYVLNSACGNDSVTIDLFVDDCDVSLRELSANALRVYPNPTNSSVTIEQLGSTSSLSVVVYSASGQRLLETSFAKEEPKRLDLANLAAGVYTLNITTPEGFSVKQVVKQ
jgi:hypothetical protein